MAAPVAVNLRDVPVGSADLEQVAGVVNRAFDRYADRFQGPRTSAHGHWGFFGPHHQCEMVKEL